MRIIRVLETEVKNPIKVSTINIQTFKVKLVAYEPKQRDRRDK